MRSPRTNNECSSHVTYIACVVSSVRCNMQWVACRLYQILKGISPADRVNCAQLLPCYGHRQGLEARQPCRGGQEGFEHRHDVAQGRRPFQWSEHRHQPREWTRATALIHSFMAIMSSIDTPGERPEKPQLGERWMVDLTDPFKRGFPLAHFTPTAVARCGAVGPTTCLPDACSTV